MDLTVANRVTGLNPANTVFLKLMALIPCIKDKSIIKNFYTHSLIIGKFIKDNVNEDNYHIFNNLFLIYLTLYAGNPENCKNKEPYKVYCDFIEGVCSKNINEAIYCYSKFMSHFTKNFRPFIYPRKELYYNDNNLSFYELYVSSMTVDILGFFSKYEVNRKKIIKEFERYPDYYDVGSSTLAIAGCYCMITNNLDKFESIANYIADNVTEIYEKMKLNGLVFDTRKLPEVDNNIDINKYIDFMIGIITNSNENNKAIH